jgi:hypothetical protein
MKPRPAFSPFVAACARPLPRTAWQCRSSTAYHSSNPSFATWRETALRSHSIRAASTTSTAKRSAKSVPVPAKRPSGTAAATPPAKQSPRKSTSSSSVPAKRTPPPTTISLDRGGPTALNPPLESYAPPLDVPERKPGQGKLKWLYQCGKAYLSFYKSGIKNVRSSSKLAKTLRAKVAAASSNGKPQDATAVLSRAEWQLTRRTRADMMRLPAFALVFLVLGEWTPLIALYLTPVIPEPCRVPAQLERMQRKAEARRAERLRRVGHDAARLVSRPGAGASELGVGDIQRFNATQARRVRDALAAPTPRVSLFELLLLSARFDAHPGLLDRLFITPPRALLVRGLRKKMGYLVTDDEMVARDGGWGGLRREEVVRACFERGVDVRGRSEAELRKVLAVWGA